MSDNYYISQYLGCTLILRFPAIADKALVDWARKELEYIQSIANYRHDLREKISLLADLV